MENIEVKIENCNDDLPDSGSFYDDVKKCIITDDVKECIITDDVNDDYAVSNCNGSLHEISSFKQEDCENHSQKKSLLSENGNASNKQLSTKNSLETHLGEKQYSCHLCSLEFLDRTAFSYHLKVHPNVKPFDCSWCEKSFGDIKNLMEHQVMHNDVFECYLCKEIFTQKMFLLHLRMKHGKRVVSNIFSCEICNKKFLKKSLFETHTRSFHAYEHSYKPTVCDKGFFDKGNLQKHNLHHGENMRKFICEICGKCFKTKDSLIRHCIIHSEEKPFKCNKCEKCFAGSCALIKHKNIHSGAKARRYECFECGKLYNKQNLLVDHLRTHIEENPFKCSECGTSFSTLCTLLRNIKRNSNSQYKCTICLNIDSVCKGNNKELHHGKQELSMNSSEKFEGIIKLKSYRKSAKINFQMKLKPNSDNTSIEVNIESQQESPDQISPEASVEMNKNSIVIKNNVTGNVNNSMNLLHSVKKSEISKDLRVEKSATKVESLDVIKINNVSSDVPNNFNRSQSECIQRPRGRPVGSGRKYPLPTEVSQQIILNLPCKRGRPVGTGKKK